VLADVDLEDLRAATSVLTRLRAVFESDDYAQSERA
jgi:hypothetical protein